MALEGCLGLWWCHVMVLVNGGDKVVMKVCGRVIGDEKEVRKLLG